MADSTINELVNLTSVANNDELVLWDTSASETKKATVSNVVTPVATSTATSVATSIATTTVGTTSGIMATGTCSTAAGTAQKVVTSNKWTNKPGESIMVEFSYANTAADVTLKIGTNSAIPIYALNTSIRLGSGTIPAGPMIFTLSADGTKFYAHTVVVDTAVTSGSSNPITSGAVYKQKFWNDNRTALSASGWYKIATFGKRNQGSVIQLKLTSDYNNSISGGHDIKLNYGYKAANCLDFSLDTASVFSKIKLCYNENNNDIMALYVYYNKNISNNCAYTIDITSPFSNINVTLFNFVTDSTVYDNEIEYDLGTNGLYVNGVKIN